MVYLISSELQQRDGVTVLPDSHQVALREILAEPNNVHVMVIDDYPSLTTTLQYLGLDYRAVIAVPDLPTPTSILYEKDNSRLIEYESFKKQIIKEDNPLEVDDAEESESDFKSI